MYYVLKMNDGLNNYIYAFSGENSFKKAKEAAESLKRIYGHQYEVVKVDIVWHTQTLAELMEREDDRPFV